MTAPLTCPTCGRPRAEGARFCIGCGIDLDQKLAAPSAEPTSPLRASPAATASSSPTAAARLSAISDALRARSRAIPVKARAALAAVCALALVAFVANGILNSPERRIAAQLEGVVQRNPTADLANADALGTQLRIAQAPADVVFSTKSLEVARARGSIERYTAAWTIEAKRNGAVLDTVTSQLLVDPYRRVSGSAATWLVSQPVEGFDLAKLLPSVATLQQAEQIVADANKANEKFESAVGQVFVDSPTADDPNGTPDPNQTPDHLLLETCPTVTDTPSTPAQIQTFYYVTSEQRIVLGSQVVVAAVTGAVTVGDLKEQDLLDQANAAIRQFSDAQGAGDVASALKVLSGADGLTKAGLSASSLGSETVKSVAERDCENRRYTVTTDLRSIVDDRGTWQIDYAGQPLDVLSASGDLAYSKGPDVHVTGEPLQVLAGPDNLSVGPTFTVRLSGGAYSYGFGRTNQGYRLRLDSVSVNGVHLGSFNGSALCDLMADEVMTCPWPSSSPALPVPLVGLKSVQVELTFGRFTVNFYNGRDWRDEYATGTITWGSPEPVPSPAPSVSP